MVLAGSCGFTEDRKRFANHTRGTANSRERQSTAVTNDTARNQYRTGTIVVRPGLTMRVVVWEAKRECGRLRLLISCVTERGGAGQAWVNAETVTAEDGRPW